MKARWKALLVGSFCLGVVATVFAYGVAVGRYQLFPFDQLRTLRRQADSLESNPGRWATARDPAAMVDRKTLERLGSLGYLRGYTPPGESSGAVVRKAVGVYEGVTLFTSGHAPVAQLISIDGEVVHEWAVAFEDLWPDDLPFNLWGEHKHFLRRAHVFPNGDLLAIFEYAGIVKLDKDSNVNWKQLMRNHHDFTVTGDGTIITLERRHLTADEIASNYPGFKALPSGFFDDQIVFRDPSGHETQRVSLFEAFYRSEYAAFLKQREGAEDIFHANSVDLVEPQELPMIRADEILVSLRELNAVVSVSVDEPRISWMLSGMFQGQHQALMLDTGRILLLDNGGGNLEMPLQLNQSEVLEFDPLTQAIVWRYAGSDAAPFFTRWLGYVQRLPNGNTLVTESSQGRIFEVTPDGLTVWEYLNPERAGESGELIATVMGAQRLRRDSLEFLEK